MFKFDKKGIFAILNLAIHFNIHIFKKIFPFFKRSGVKDFEKNFFSENLFPFRKDEREKIFNFEKCINCGICSSECSVISVLNKNKFLEPRIISSSISRSLDFANLDEIIYNCLLCESCKIVCPQDVEIPEIISFIKSKIPKKTKIFLNLVNYKNIYGEKTEYFKEFEKDGAEYVFFAGCVGRYKERESIKKSILLLKILGVDFTTIEEVHCGRSILNLEEELFKKLSEENLKNIQKKNANKIITSCPECYFTFKNSPYYKGKFQVFHITSFLKKFDLNFKKIDKKITYHDPCDLGRLSNIYEEPRDLIRKITDNFVEMKNIRWFSRCCGSREGIKIEEEEIIKKLSFERIKEAENSGAEILLTECPSCLNNFRNVSKKIEVYSISEYILNILNKEGETCGSL